MLSVTDSPSDPPDLTQSESRSMEEESQASGLEQSESEEISMSDDPMHDPSSELSPPPENADLGQYINCIDDLTNDQKYRLLTQPFTPSKHYKFPV